MDSLARRKVSRKRTLSATLAGIALAEFLTLPFSMQAQTNTNVTHFLLTDSFGRVVRAVGLIFLVLGGSREWKLPLALAVTVLLSTYVVRVQVMWRQAPITAAIVIAAVLTHHSELTAIEVGIRRVGEVMLGCVVGLAVTWLMSRIWPVHTPAK